MDVGISALNLLTLQNVRAVLQCSQSTVEKLVRNGEIEVVRIGRLVRVRPHDLAAYIDRLRAT
jgi:excisionase family DNA binding protein